MSPFLTRYNRGRTKARFGRLASTGISRLRGSTGWCAPAIPISRRPSVTTAGAATCTPFDALTRMPATHPLGPGPGRRSRGSAGRPTRCWPSSAMPSWRSAGDPSGTCTPCARWQSSSSPSPSVTVPLQLGSAGGGGDRPYNRCHMAQEMIEQDTQLISISDSALTQLRDLLQKQGRPEMGLRVFVQPGGCSGMSYGMGFEDRPEEGDAISVVGGVRLFVDSVSARYIKGAEIDFVDSLMGGGFTVHNPNAVSSCSCGSSFDTGGDGRTARRRSAQVIPPARPAARGRRPQPSRHQPRKKACNREPKHECDPRRFVPLNDGLTATRFRITLKPLRGTIWHLSPAF